MKTLFERGCQIIAARTQWETKQRLYSVMRHDGLRRRRKPFPGAADMHFPLIDMNIRKGKPFWIAQATSTERLASFVALQQQEQPLTTAAADFFDFEIKQNSNFMIELFSWVDTMCLRGRGAMKVVTDPFDDHRIVCEAIDTPFILMAEGANDFEDADEFIHVQHLTVGKYKRDRLLDQDPDVIKRIKGYKDLDTSTGVFQDKEVREGVNFTRNPNIILKWEHWLKTANGWTVYTYSPLYPEIALRRPFGCPYKFAGKPSVPFFSCRMEIKEGGWYSSRGMGELGAEFESYACKLWNEKTDAMTFANRPVLTSEQRIPNTDNIRWAPGEIIPGNIKGVPFEQPAYSFDQEIAFVRSTSEQQNMLPDFGVTQPGQKGDSGSPRTATENNRIAGLQTVGTESNGTIFRLDLARVYRHMWGLMLQYKREKMIYYAGKELKTLPEEALHDAYLITPDGAPDQWNKQQRVMNSRARLQIYGGAQNVDQDVLVRDALAAEDPKLALEAFIPSNVKAGSEAEDEAAEILIMKDGFPAQVKPNEDHVTRIHLLMSWLQKMEMSRVPVDPAAQQRVQQHLLVHLMYLQKLQPQAAAQVKQELAQMEAAAHQAMAARRTQPAALPPGEPPDLNAS